MRHEIHTLFSKYRQKGILIDTNILLLWKGKRHTELEQKVIAAVAEMIHQNLWDVFVSLDSEFEAIAAEGDLRLARSIST